VQIAERVYQQLAPDERFRAAVEAFWRLDGEEMDRLNDTCPFETVRIQSTKYFGRLRGFVELAMTHGILARDVMLGVWVCIWKLSKEGKSAFDYTPETVAGDGSDQLSDEAEKKTDDPDDDSTESTLVRLIGRLKAYQGAWREFCESVGVDPEKTYFSYYRESQGITELFEELEVDSDLQAEQLGHLRSAWELRAR
jgi:hypothetical protein